ERALERGPRVFDIDLGALDRKFRRLEQVQRGTHDEMRFVRIDAHERVHDGIELELVRVRARPENPRRSQREERNDAPRVHAARWLPCRGRCAPGGIKLRSLAIAVALTVAVAVVALDVRELLDTASV